MQNLSKSYIRGLATPVLLSYSTESSSKSDIIKLKLKKKLPSLAFYDKETLQVVQDLFEGLEKDPEGKVPAKLLAAQLVKRSLLIEKKPFLKRLSKIYTNEDLDRVKFNFQDFYILVVGDRKADKIIEGVRKNLTTKKSILPDIKSTRSSVSPIKLKIIKHHFPGIEENSPTDFFGMALLWWEEISQGKVKVPYVEVLNLFLQKEIAFSIEDCKDLIGLPQDYYNKSDFLSLFVFPILKSQLLELSRKRSSKKLSKSFIPSYQKLKKFNKSLLKRSSPNTLHYKLASPPNQSRLKQFITALVSP